MRKKRIIYLALFFLSLAGGLKSQVTVTGLVTDKKEPVKGASISLSGSYDGATSDSTGKFSFRTSEKGEFQLTVTSIGYRTHEQNIRIDKQDLNFVIQLKEEITELKAVVVTAGTFEASDRKKATVLNPIDIVTTASANADVTGALKTLPGAQQVGEAEGLFVRGGTSAETKTFIDGTLVNNFFYSSLPNVATRGRFSPFIFKGTVFSAGGYSALYGQAMSSAVILESIDLPERSSASLNFSVIGIGGGFQHLSKNKRSSFGFSYDHTNLLLAFAVIKQNRDFFRMPVYNTADLNFRFKTSNSGILKYYGYFNTGKIGFRTNSIDTLGYKDMFSINNFNTYHNLSWKESIGRGWKFTSGVSYSNNKDDIKSGLEDQDNNKAEISGLEFRDYSADLRGNYLNAKVVLEKKFPGLSALRFGGEYNYSNDRSLFTAFNGDQFRDTLTEHIKSAFAEADIYITNNIAVKLGSRLEHSAILAKTNIAPRISLAYKLGRESQASLAYGIFYQNPERRYLPSSEPLDFSHAQHYIAQYQKVSNQLTFRAEVFYKKYHKLVKTGYENYREVATSNLGYGEAKGFEFFWRDRKSIKNFDYWISYSFLDTKRDFLNYPEAIRPAFAASHTASFVAKKFVSKLKTMFNASYTFATGRPYYNIRYDQGESKFMIHDKGRTINYNSLSLSLNFLPNINKPGASRFSVFVLQVNNVFNSKQVFGYQYSNTGHRKEAIVPSSRMFVFIGAFLSFGIDRTQDIIDSKL